MIPGESPSPDFFARPAASLARALLGCYVVRNINSDVLIGKIVETEAYVGARDAASHAFGGRRTARNQSMYAAPGTAYIYFTYGMHYCLNVSAYKPDHPAAVLVRALEPVEGISQMLWNRGRGDIPLHSLMRGPGNVCKALLLDTTLDGEPLWKSNSLRMCGRVQPLDRGAIASSPRIGIGDKGIWTNKPLRVYLQENPSVSGKR